MVPYNLQGHVSASASHSSSISGSTYRRTCPCTQARMRARLHTHVPTHSRRSEGAKFYFWSSIFLHSWLVMHTTAHMSMLDTCLQTFLYACLHIFLDTVYAYDCAHAYACVYVCVQYRPTSISRFPSSAGAARMCTDGRTDGHTGGRASGRVDMQTDARTHTHTNACTRTHVHMQGWSTAWRW